MSVERESPRPPVRDLRRQGREVLLEFRSIGNVVKVTAVDPVTQVEVSIQGPASAGEAELRRIAVAKLDYVLSRARRDPPT